MVLAGLTVRQIGYWRDTVTLFEHAIAVEDCDYSRGNLATTLNEQGRYREAEVHLRKAIQLAPNEFDHRINLVSVLVRTGRLEEASVEEQEALRLGPDRAMAVEMAGLISLRRGFYRDALMRFDQAGQLGFDQVILASALNDAGASLASHGRPADAEALIRKAVDFNAGLVQARRNLVLVLSDQGKTDEARASLRRAIEVFGARPEFRDLVRELDPKRP